MSNDSKIIAAVNNHLMGLCARTLDTLDDGILRIDPEEIVELWKAAQQSVSAVGFVNVPATHANDSERLQFMIDSRVYVKPNYSIKHQCFSKSFSDFAVITSMLPHSIYGGATAREAIDNAMLMEGHHAQKT